MKCISLMSGTSLDGIDGLLCDIKYLNDSFKIVELDFQNISYSTILKNKILKNLNPNSSSIKELCELNFELANLSAKLVENILKLNNLKSKDIDYIAMHGQTFYHIPKSQGIASTLQLSDPCVLSALTKIEVINNFRSADIAMGGQGAPLVPISDLYLYKKQNTCRILVNIGGISNFTIIDEIKKEYLGYDVGPGNVLIDTMVQKYYNLDFDQNGSIAKSGTILYKNLKKVMESSLPVDLGVSNLKKSFSITFFTKILKKLWKMIFLN